MKKLHVGCGPKKLEGYEHLDKYHVGNHIDYKCDAKDIPTENNTYTEIYARHWLEHLEQNDAKATLKVLKNKLVEGGYIHILVPDIEFHCKQIFLEGKSKFTGTTNFQHAMASIYGWNQNNGMGHKWGYTRKTIEELFNSLDMQVEFIPTRECDIELKAYKKISTIDISITKGEVPEGFKFLITLPDRDYYTWQMLVQLNNFKKLGYDSSLIYLISHTGKLSDHMQKIIDSKEFKATFITYKDDREAKNYPVSLKPYLVKNFVKDYPELAKNTLFYTDPDVIFTKPMDFSKYIKDDIWYLSDTKSYLDSKYIKSKGEQLFIEMCEIANIDPALVIQNDVNAGGAQWIVKNTTYEYWDRVEKMSEDLYKHMKDTASKYNPKHPIQAWTSEMWATIWAAWDMGYKTTIDKELDFCWATYNLKRWDNYYIFHNAGVTAKTTGGHFSKVKHTTSPFKKGLEVNPDSASAAFVEWIKDTEKTYPNLIW